MKRLVFIESPYAGDIPTHLKYLDRAMRDCFMRGEAPFASHGLYTRPGVLNDSIPEERNLGIEAGLMWAVHADRTVVYADYGISRGMRHGIAIAKQQGRKVEIRYIGGVDGEDYSNSGPPTVTKII